MSSRLFILMSLKTSLFVFLAMIKHPKFHIKNYENCGDLKFIIQSNGTDRLFDVAN